MYLFQLIFKELRNHPHFVILFVTHLSLGLSGFVSLDIFKHSVDQTLKRKAKAIMGADLALSSRRPISKKERQIVRQTVDGSINESQITQLYSMALGSSGESRLAQIKAIEENFPFYGGMTLLNQGEIKNSGSADLHHGKTAWVYPEILIQMKLKIGDTISIGSEKFHISDVIEDDPSGSLIHSIAPRIYISHKNLSHTRLVQPGSLAQYSYVYKIGSEKNSLIHIKEKIFSQLDDPQMKIRSPVDSSENLGRLMGYLNDFLSLAALSALFIACVGMGFIVHSYFKKKIYEIAILNTLGLSSSKTALLYLGQVCVLGLFSFFFACSLGFLLFFLLKNIISDIFSFETNFNFISASAFLAVLIPIGICCPLISKIRKIKTQALLSGNTPKDSHPLLFLIPGLAILWILAVWQSHSFYTGTLFTVLFLSSGILLLFFFWIFFMIIKKGNIFSSHILRWSFRDLLRHKPEMFSCFLSLSLGILLINLIPQIYTGLQEEIKYPEKSKRPSFFIFDIQEYQLDELKTLLSKNNITLDKISPMIGGRLLSVNNKAFDKGERKKQWTREREREMDFRNRGINLSYRDFIYKSEKILKGSFWNESYDPLTKKYPGISMEARFAKRLDLKLGDILTFDVQNQKITGQIQNLRKVKWSTFDPNFFILFQNGVLNFANKTFLAVIPQLPHLLKSNIQNKIVSHFQNISLVNVTRMTQKIFSLFDQMLKALQLITILCLLIGFMVLYTISSYQIESRKKELALLKILGFSFSDIKLLFLFQWGLITFISALFGLILSLGLSYLLSSLFFDSIWIFSPYVSFGILAGAVLVALMVGHLAVKKTLKTPVRILFSE